VYRLTKDDPDFTADLRAFLSRNYDLKTVADYEIGLDAQISPEQALTALQQAKRFVAYIKAKLAAD
jgi:uncharacterized protein (UPF0332 family)